MTDKELETKLIRIFHLGQNYGVDGESDSFLANKRCDKWEQTFQTLKQEIVLEFQKQQKESSDD
jgi:hypothetical protein